MTIKRTLQLWAKDENVAVFHIGPYVFMFVAAMASAITPLFSSIPIDAQADRGEYYSGTYSSLNFWIWIGLALLCPLLVMVSYWLPTRIHDSRYACLWLRWGGDAGQLFALVVLELSTIKLVTDSVIYRHILFYGYVFFVLCMLTRDVLLIIASERLAAKMERDKHADGRC